MDDLSSSIVQLFDGLGRGDPKYSRTQLLADALSRSSTDTLLLKYGRVPEQTLDAAFRQLEEETRDDRTVFVYVPLDAATLDLSLMEGKIAWYHHLVGRLLDGLSRSRFGSQQKVMEMQSLYQTDFGKICAPYDPLVWFPLNRPEGYAPPILSPHENEGDNLSKLISHLVGNQNTNSVQLVFNFAFLPTFPAGSVHVNPEEVTPADVPLRPDDLRFHDYVTQALDLVGNLAYGTEGWKKTIAMPGFLIDILSGSFENQYWNDSQWAEGAISEDCDFSYFQRIRL
ncbi:hypothetical protein HZB02_07090 [Candidatus Woesearchaeota archaeon]|nr:hypothetical protein [Candidatus Woesearchaeota archaeon]